jgi:hypothetical protein
MDMLYMVVLMVLCVALAAVTTIILAAQEAPEPEPVRVKDEIRPRH